jgi:hypothetical protein
MKIGSLKLESNESAEDDFDLFSEFSNDVQLMKENQQLKQKLDLI